jgi:uncharacterized protein (DUF1684 family)
MSRLSAALALALLACTPREPSKQPADIPIADLEEASRFQRDYEAALKASPTSFLTAVAAHYLGPGESLSLASREGAWVEVEAGAEDAAVVVEVLPEGDRLEVRAGGQLELFESAGELELDPAAPRWRLALSPQAEDWRVLVHDAEARARRDFAGLEWFPLHADYIVDADYEPLDARSPTLLQTSRGLAKTLHAAARLRFELAGESHTLTAYAYGPQPRAGEPLLVPFADASNGERSYAAGRYLELEAPGAEVPVLRIDFNRATNPLCAYSEHYNCPLPPKDNRLSVAIPAGALAPTGH